MKIAYILKFLCIAFFSHYSISSSYSKPAIELKCEYKINPIGIQTMAPRLSWKIPEIANQRGISQKAYQIQVATSLEDLLRSNNLVWDSQKVATDKSIHNPYKGPKLEAKTIYYWRVKVWDNINDENDWSESASWEMSLLSSSNWNAEWIEPNLVEKEKAYNPCPLLRRKFKAKNKIAKARLYITSKGLYEAFINGQAVGDQLFTPGWTSYNKRLQYQIYDVTDLIEKDQNALSVRLGDGWYRGQFDSYDRWNNNYGKNTALLCQLELTYTNGEKETISSDKKWKSSTGAIVMSGLYDGEVYDASLEKKGWLSAAYSDKKWSSIKVVAHDKNLLVSSEGVPIRKMEVLKPRGMIRTPKGEDVIDMGQNMVGWIKLKVKGNPGDTVTLYHAEVLDKEGNFYTANLRTADQKVQYILNDKEESIFEPHFTFHGFRYVKIEGISNISLDDFEGIVIYSDMKQSGNFECSNEKINKLQSNITWGQKGNFIDIPMDCPQRDERMGWTGDAQVFCSTASFNYDVNSFFTKWLQDLKADQLENGSVPWAIPDVLHRNGSAGWGDAATIIPWTLYLKYGDLRILERQYESMKSWVNYLEELSEGNFLVQKGFHFGDWNFFIHPTDWNDKPGYSDKDFIATAFFAHSTGLLLKSAQLLGKENDTQKYSKLLRNIKIAFQAEFMTPSGRLSPHSQTAYTLALSFDLIPEESRKHAVNYLVKDITARKFHLSTGFLGTPHLCHALSSNGHTDVAYKLLFQESHPSWLYPINNGATTLWERWDGIKPDGSFQDIKANSFNHYAYGAVGDWLYRVVAGIEVDEKVPGYKKIIIQPHPSSELTFAKASYESMYGLIESNWELSDDKIFKVTVRIPPNATASIHLPDAELSSILENNLKLSQTKGIYATAKIENNCLITVGSGTYEFSYRMSTD